MKQEGTNARRVCMRVVIVAGMLMVRTLLGASNAWAQVTVETNALVQENGETRRVSTETHSVKIDPVDVTVTGQVETQTFTITEVKTLGVITGTMTVDIGNWNIDDDPLAPPEIVFEGVFCDFIDADGNVNTKRLAEIYPDDQTRALAVAYCTAPPSYFEDCHEERVEVQTWHHANSSPFAALLSALNAPDGGAVVTLRCETTDIPKVLLRRRGGKVTVTQIDNSGPYFQASTVKVAAFFDGILAALGDFLSDLLDAVGGLLDFVPPILETSGDQTVVQVLPGGAPVSFAAESRDVDIFGNSVDIFGNVIGDPSPLVECRDQDGTPRRSGAVFAVGTWTITCDTWDHKYDILQDKYLKGNHGTPKSFTIKVLADTTPPVLTVPDDIFKEATGVFTFVTYSATAFDNVDDELIPDCDPTSDSGFTLGTTTVTCTATDTTGNEASASFTVTIEDTTPPTIFPPPNITTEATGPTGAVVNYEVSATDNTGQQVDLECTPLSDSTFALGSTVVTCTAVDLSDNEASASFTVTVQDTTAPGVVFTSPADGAEVPQGDALVATYGCSDIADVAPACGGKVDESGDNVASGALVETSGLGSHTFTVTATDASENSTVVSHAYTVVPDPAKEKTDPVSGEFVKVSVTDPDTNPDVSVATMTVEPLPDGVTPPDGIQLLYGLVGFTIENVPSDGTVDVTVQFPTSAGPLPNRYFKLSADGTSLVDASSIATINNSTNTVVLHLMDNGPFDFNEMSSVIRDPGTFTVDEPPSLTVPDDISVVASDSTGAVVNYEVSAFDGYDGSLTPMCTNESGETFPIGDTTVTCSVTDSIGNEVTKTFLVHVGYTFAGFFPPVDNETVNVIRAGQSVPMKFSLGDYFGLEVIASTTWDAVPCEGGSESEVEEAETAGQSGLQYDANTGMYTYVWKTLSALAKDTCLTFKMTLRDNTIHSADFKIK